jgi:hypothetical protein
MAVAKVLARDWTIEVQLANESYQAIGGINSFSPSPEKNDADTTDFDSAGNLEHLPASRGMSYTFEGFFLVDVATGARDTGQERVEVLGDLVGPAGLGHMKLTSPPASGAEVWDFDCSINVTPPGGGNDDAASWSFEATVSGAINKA